MPKLSSLRALRPVLAISVGSLLTATAAFAADQTWIDTNANNNWSLSDTDNNWDSGVAWAQGNNAIFGGGGDNVALTTGITVGNITFNSSAYAISGSTLTLGASAIDTGANNATISSILGGDSLTKAGDGMLTLTGANNFSGATSVNGGILRINSTNGGLNSTSGITIHNGGTLEFTASANNKDGIGSGNKAITVNSGGVLKVSTQNAMGYNAQTNYANITLNGGTFTLNAVQYINSLTLDTGSAVNGSSSIQYWYVAPTAISALGDSIISAGINLNNAAIQNFSAASGKTLTISGVIAGNGGFTKQGTGVVLLTNTNTYSGTTTINAGTVQAGNANALGSGAIVIGGGALQIGAAVDLIAKGRITLNANISGGNVAITSAGAGVLQLRSTTSSATSPDIYFNANDADNSNANYGTSISAPIDLGGSQRYIWGKTNHNSVSRYLATSGADAEFKGAISGSGGLTFIAQHTYTSSGSMEVPFVLSGSNTFTGMVEVRRGSVYLNNANALSQGNALLLSPGAGNNARLFLYGNNASVSNLTSSGAGASSIANGNAPSGIATQLGAGTLTVNQTSATTYAGTLVDHIAEYNSNGSQTQGPLALVKTGPASLTLTGANTHTGGTTVSAGALNVDGSISGTTTVNGGTLGGSGTVGDVILTTGAIAPGDNVGSTGTLTAGSVAFNGGEFVLDLASAGSFDQLKVTGAVTSTAPVALTLNLTFDPADDGSQSFKIMDDAFAVSEGLFSYNSTTLSEGAHFTVNNLQEFSISYFSGDGNDVVLTAIPEPGALTAMLGGMAILLGARRRRVA